MRRGANCYYRYATSAEVAKKGNFRGFLDFSQKGLAGICSDSLQMLSRPFPFVPRARIGCPISMRVTLKIRAVCGHQQSNGARPPVRTGSEWRRRSRENTPPIGLCDSCTLSRRRWLTKQCGRTHSLSYVGLKIDLDTRETKQDEACRVNPASRIGKELVP